MKTFQRLTTTTAVLLTVAATSVEVQTDHAPDFSFTSRGGEHIALEDLNGQTVVIDFWGSWCKPCVGSAPALVRLHDEFAGRDVVFLGIAAKDKEDRWGRFIEANKLTWPQYLDRKLTLVHLFHVRAYPTYIVIDGKGVIQGRRVGAGPATDAWLEKTIGATLGVGDQGPGARGQGPGTRDQGSGIRDQGSGIRDQGSGARDQGPGTRDQEITVRIIEPVS